MNYAVGRLTSSRRLWAVLVAGAIIAGCGSDSDSSRGGDAAPGDSRVGDAGGDTPVRTPAAAPSFSPAGGTFLEPQQVTLISTSPNVQIHYTVDGSEPTAASPLYQAPIAVAVTTTIKALAVDPTGVLSNSPSSTATYTFAARVPPPVFSLPAGTYNSAQLVTLTDSNPNAIIRYTTDGTEPTAASTLYSMPISVSATTTIKAIAIATGLTDSLVVSAQYTIQILAAAATPTFNPVAGTYAGAQDVTIASSTPGAEITYTLDGTEPTQGSTRYQAPVHIANSAVLKAKAFATGMAPSVTATASYAITQPAAAKPTISPNGGSFTAAQTVTLSTTEADGQIIFTTDGSIPSTTSGSIYTGPFTLAHSATVNAIVVNVAGKSSSPIATAAFTITIELPIAFDKLTGTYNNDVSVAITSSASGATVCYTKDGSEPTCSTAGTCAIGQATGGNLVVVNANASPTAGTTVRARACKTGMAPGPVVSQTYTLAVAPVAFDPPGNTLQIGSSVTMKSETVGAEIRYRDDDTDPTCTSGTLYSAPVALGQSKRFRAIACKANYVSGALVSATYGVKLSAPVALQKSTLGEYVAVGAVATVPKTIADLVFALGKDIAPVTSQTLCYSVNGTAPSCTTAGACDTSVTGVYTKTLQGTADAVFGTPSNVVGDGSTEANNTIAAPSNGSATLTVKAAFCAPNFSISDVTAVAYTFKVATPTISRADGKTTLASENAEDIIATTTPGAKLRYYKIASGVTPPALSCTDAVVAPVEEVAGITKTIQVNGGDSVAAIACLANYVASDTATASYPLPGATVAPVFSTQGTTLFDNDIAAGALKITDADIADVGDSVLAPAGVVCWTMADSGTVDCNEHATAPTCVAPPAPGGTYQWNPSAAPAASNIPAISGSGVTLRAIACAPGKKKSTVTSQTFSFQVAPVTITYPPLSTSDRIGVGESLAFATPTVGATIRYTTGTTNLPPANPNCSLGTGTVASSYAVTAGDESNGSLIVKVVACKNNYAPSAVATSTTFTVFRGAAAAFGIPAGTYADVLEASSSNTPAGLQSVSVADATGLARICVTRNGTVPICTAEAQCAGQDAAAGHEADDVIGGANGIANNGTIAWSNFDSSGFTLQAQPCYTTRANPPVTVSGPYDFQVAPLTMTNTTPEPNAAPFTKTQRIVFRVGNEAGPGVEAVDAPWETAVGTVRLCYTTDGSDVAAGCNLGSSGSTTCVAMTEGGPASRTYTMYVDGTSTIKAKACKSVMLPATASQTLTFAPYSRTLSMSGSNEFVGHEAKEAFSTLSGPAFYTTWDATYLYLGWQGCGINSTNADDANHFALAYLGVPGQQGIAVGSAFVAGTDPAQPGARWQVKYLVGGGTAQIKIRNFSTNDWDTLAESNITAVHGAGTSAGACASAADNPGDYVIVRIPRAVVGSPSKIAIAEGINVGIPAQPDNADVYGWPFTSANFDTAAAVFSLTAWQPPTGAAGCTPSGLDGHATCQIAP